MMDTGECTNHRLHKGICIFCGDAVASPAENDGSALMNTSMGLGLGTSMHIKSMTMDRETQTSDSLMPKFQPSMSNSSSEAGIVEARSPTSCGCGTAEAEMTPAHMNGMDVDLLGVDNDKGIKLPKLQRTYGSTTRIAATSLSGGSSAANSDNGYGTPDLPDGRRLNAALVPNRPLSRTGSDEEGPDWKAKFMELTTEMDNLCRRFQDVALARDDAMAKVEALTKERNRLTRQLCEARTSKTPRNAGLMSPPPCLMSPPTQSFLSSPSSVALPSPIIEAPCCSPHSDVSMTAAPANDAAFGGIPKSPKSPNTRPRVFSFTASSRATASHSANDPQPHSGVQVDRDMHKKLLERRNSHKTPGPLDFNAVLQRLSAKLGTRVNENGTVEEQQQGGEEPMYDTKQFEVSITSFAPHKQDHIIRRPTVDNSA